MFMDNFDNISIARYDIDTGEILKYIAVPVKFAPKEKNFYWLERRDDEGRLIRDVVLPMIGIYMTGVEFSNDRDINKFYNHTKHRAPDGTISRFTNPAPYDINVEVKIAAEYLADITQIIEQVLPFFNPTNFIRVTIPELNVDSEVDEGTESLELKVIYTGSSQEFPVEMSEDVYRTLIWTLNFRIESFLFTPPRNEKLIKKVVNKIYTSEKTWAHSLDTTTETISGGGHMDEEILVEATADHKMDNNGHILYKWEIFGSK
jgi:hypothetical protein